nr:phage portal protein [Streptomyces agglomeratus]
MASRRFLPALRSLIAGSPPPAETKAIAWSSGAYSAPYSGTSNIWGTEGRADGWDMDRVITEGYERVVWVFKAVDTIGKHASRLPLELGRGLTEEGEFEETFPDHPLLRLLNGQANPLETGQMFRKRLSAQILLSKRGAFVEKTRSRAGTLTRVDLLPPDRVLPIPDPNGDYLSHFEFTTRQGVVRELSPDRVLWIRDPHPTDPFSGVTPLEAAGISVDMDHLSRLYNVTFIKNDARPGGVLAVDTATLSPTELDRLESRFLPGSDYAGHLSVIGAGPGGMNYVDTAAQPRDMNYEHASANAKLEILAAFGVPESVTGNASGRTFDNAEQEELGFWLHTELGHLELIANAFEKDAGDDARLRYDTSTVEVLELPRRRWRAEAREEWNAGLINIDEYRMLAGFEAYGNPHTRALWISPQKAPVPLVPDDAAALGIGGTGQEPGGAGMPPGPNSPLEPGQGDAEGAAALAVGEARGELPAGPGGADGPAAAAVTEARATLAGAEPGSAAAAVAEASTDSSAVPEEGPAAAAVDEARGLQTKALKTATGFSVDDGDFDRARGAVESALNPVRPAGRCHHRAAALPEGTQGDEVLDGRRADRHTRRRQPARHGQSRGRREMARGDHRDPHADSQPGSAGDRQGCGRRAWQHSGRRLRRHRRGRPQRYLCGSGDNPHLPRLPDRNAQRRAARRCRPRRPRERADPPPSGGRSGSYRSRRGRSRHRDGERRRRCCRRSLRPFHHPHLADPPRRPRTPRP